MGDGFLFEFPSALSAVQGAAEMQQALYQRDQTIPMERQVRIRFGIHVGDVVLRAGDIHGNGVNIAARIEPLAASGRICVSEEVARAVRNKASRPLVPIGRKLGVATIVTCNVRRTGKQVRVPLELRGASGETVLWRQTYDREIEDVFSFRNEMAACVANVFQMRGAKGFG